MSGFDFSALLAAQNNPGNWFFLWKILLFLGATLFISIIRKVSEIREKSNKGNTVGKSPPAVPKKDNPFRNEIEAFLDEVGKRRAAGERSSRPPGARGETVPVQTKTLAAPRSEPPRKPVALRPTGTSDRDKSKPEPTKAVVIASGPPARPGEEIAARKAPGSEDLGKQIRTHLAQYLDPSRMANQTQNDLGNSVDRTVRQHLGTTITAPAETEQAAVPKIDGSQIVPLLRNRSNVRTAIVINEILGRPKGLSRRR
jgi:hypothetical protein